jgi:hypothetical protein
MTRVQGYTCCPRADLAGIGCRLPAVFSKQDFFVANGGEKFFSADGQRIEIQNQAQVDHLVLPILPAIFQILKFLIRTGFSKKEHLRA